MTAPDEAAAGELRATPDRLGAGEPRVTGPDEAATGELRATPDRLGAGEPRATPDETATAELRATPDRLGAGEPRATFDRLGAGDLPPAGPAVSVVIPTHNRRELLAETLASVWAQTVPVEVIVVDDGSSDGTAESLEGQDVTVVRLDEPRGCGAARNVGVERTTAPWLAFCDDDDLWAPERLAAQLAVLADHPTARWATTGAVWIDQSRRILGGQAMPDYDDLEALLRVGNAVPGGGSSVLIDADLYAAVGGFAPGLDGADDWDLWLRLAAKSPIGYVDRPLVGYRRWRGNRSRNLTRAEVAHADVRRRHGISPDASGDADQQWRMHRARVLVENDDRFGAAAAYVGAALRSPGQLAYAAAVLASPGRVERRLRAQDAARLPAGWREEARRWLGAR